MYPIILSTPWFNIYSYGLLIAAGYTVGTIWIIREAQRDKLDYELIFDMLIFQLIVGILGSRLLFVLEYTPEKLNFSDFFKFEQGGLTFYGSVISSFIFDLLYLKYKRIPFWRAMDTLGFGIPIGIAIARLGCLLNGCCYGTQCSLPWGISFPAAGGGYQHPTQIYESICALLIFAILQLLRNRRRNYGEAFLASMALYSFFRFFIEFFRAENPIIAGGMTLAQIIGIITLGACIITWHLIRKNRELRIIPDSAVYTSQETSEK